MAAGGVAGGSRRMARVYQSQWRRSIMAALYSWLKPKAVAAAAHLLNPTNV